MQTGIGATLREARNRRKVDLSEVEAATKIRARYLRALENEEWDVLPGDAYARSFLRTYASFLGLDGDRLADEYRRRFTTGPVAERAPGGEPVVAPRSPRRGPRLPPRVLAAIVSVGLVVALVVVGLSSGGEESTTPAEQGKRGDRQHRQGGKTAQRTPKPGVSVRLAANAEVWVCLLDAGGRRLVDGQVLDAGAEEGPFRSGSFTVSFGNGEVSMRIDGREESIPPSASPVGYAIDSSGTLRKLSEGERPTCT